jgi:hypothetical protein
MSTNLAKPSRQAVHMASGPRRLSPKLREACELMVEEGLDYQQAAERVGFQTRTMRLALQRPHVLKHLRRMREVFLERICLENPRHLAELRGQRSNMGAAVRAIGTLEAMNDVSKYGSPRGVAMSPGLAIVIVDRHAPTARPTTIDVTPKPDREPDDAA